MNIHLFSHFLQGTFSTVAFAGYLRQRGEIDGIKITLKHEKLHRMLNHKIVQALVAGVFTEDPEEFLEALHLKIIPFKMQIVSKMYEVKTFEEVEMDLNLSHL